MLKKFYICAALGSVLFFAGVFVHDFARIPVLGEILAIGGLGFGLLALGILAIPVCKKLSRQIAAAANEKVRTRAYEDLLRLKTLLDAGIVSQQEFDVKSRDLKSKIL